MTNRTVLFINVCLLASKTKQRRIKDSKTGGLRCYSCAVGINPQYDASQRGLGHASLENLECLRALPRHSNGHFLADLYMQY